MQSQNPQNLSAPSSLILPSESSSVQISSPLGGSSSVPPSNTSFPTPKKHTKLFLGFFAVIALIIFSSIAVLGYTYFAKKPEAVLYEALKKSSEASSAVLSFKSSDKTFTMDGIFHDTDKENKLSRLSFNINKIENRDDNNLSASLIFNSKEIYAQATYSKLKELVTGFSLYVPNIESLETYKLLLPVLQGEKWISFVFPEEKTPQTVTPTVSSLDRDYEKVLKNFQDALIVHRFDRSYKKDNVSYTRISLGFDKQKLMSAIDSLKDTDLDIKVSQINAIVKFVESVDNWDSDLIDVLISGDGYVREVSLRIPDIPEKSLDELIAEGSKEREELLYLRNFTSQIEGVIQGKKEGKLVDIGVLKLDSYNNAPAVSKPTEVVTFEEMSAAATKELLPLLGAMLGGSMQQPTLPQNQQLKLPPGGQGGYVYSTIEPGKPGSKEWEEEFWKNWNEMGVKNDAMQKQVEESQKKFCEENPNLCN